MSNKRQPTIDKDLACKECGFVQTIRRFQGKNKESGHVKHIYCVMCKDVTEHEEQ